MSIEQLQRFCAHPQDRATLSKPFRCLFDGASWSCGTDGRRMLAVQGQLAEQREGVPDASHVLSIAFGAPVLGEIDLAALAAFCGVPTQPIECGACLHGRVTCDECDGSGEMRCECSCGHEHEVTCRECNGIGDQECPRCSGWRKLKQKDCRVVIGESVFDRGLVAASLVDADRTSGTAVLSSRGNGGLIAISGDGWAIVIMPLANDGDLSRATMPAFPLPMASAGGTT